MAELYPDEIEYLEKQAMSDIELDPIDDYQLCDDSKAICLKAYLKSTVPDYSDSNELEPTERDDSIIQLESAG